MNREPIKPEDKKNGFYEDIYPKEIDEIKKRRNLSDPEPPVLDPNAPPSTKHGIIGLALSGGGIRSATFSLGVIQGLLKKKVFRFMDYLSTVSGGGYLGSCLSSLLNNRKDSEDLFKSTDDVNVVKQLRNNCNYLSPPGILNTLRLPLVVVRGIFLNLFLLMPLIIFSVVFTEILNEIAYPTFKDFHNFKWFLMAPLGILLVLFLSYPFAMKAFREKWEKRNQFELYMSKMLALMLAILIFLPLLKLVGHTVNCSIVDIWTEINGFFTLKHSIITGSIIFLVLILVIFTRLRILITRITVGLIGPLFILLLYLWMCIYFIESPFVDISHRAELEKIVRASADGTFNQLKNEKGYLRLIHFLDVQELIGGNPDDITGVNIEKGSAETGGTVWKISGLKRGKPVHFTIQDKGDFLFLHECSITTGHVSWELYIIGIIIGLFNFFFLDINMISMHGFYRDRLSRAYIFKDGENGSIVQNDRQKLSRLNMENSCAPYHIINTALNVPASSNRDLRGRNTDFFIFSRHYCGSQLTGYCETEKLEKCDPHMNLGTAMAISAAAAAPSMGTQKLSQFAFIMTLLNVRLNYWVPNPSYILADKFMPQFTGPGYLLKEALRGFNERTRKVNLSDGGHIENLAIYELLKRRCKLIIAVDGEADPNMHFKGLCTLIRYAGIDMGIKIDINLDEIRKDPEGLSRRQWSLGEIRYPADQKHGLEEETGLLLYIKLSRTGKEAEFIGSYQREHPLFPHQSTADQFFDETQFEVYRALGEQIVHTIFPDGTKVRKTCTSSEKFLRWVQKELPKVRTGTGN